MQGQGEIMLIVVQFNIIERFFFCRKLQSRLLSKMLRGDVFRQSGQYTKCMLRFTPYFMDLREDKYAGAWKMILQ